MGQAQFARRKRPRQAGRRWAGWIDEEVEGGAVNASGGCMRSLFVLCSIETKQRRRQGLDERSGEEKTPARDLARCWRGGRLWSRRIRAVERVNASGRGVHPRPGLLPLDAAEAEERRRRGIDGTGPGKVVGVGKKGAAV